MTTDYFAPGQLRWLLGIEDTCVYPPTGSTMGQLDEHHLTGHDDRWRQDLDTVADLGATGLRYGISWPLVHTTPDTFDWTLLDERLRYAVDELGLTVIADLVHYGTPTWLDGSFSDPRYPAAIASFAAEFAARYRGLVDHITPLNEPLTTASFCGLRGVWPPALTGWDGWTAVTLAIVDGIRQSIDAIRVANPDAVIVHVEASAIYESDDPTLQAQVQHHEAIARLPLELLLGKVDETHELWTFLLEHGAVAARMLEFHHDVPEVDVLGVNYYPDLTPRMLRRSGDEVLQVTMDRGANGLRAVLTDAWTRHGLPIAITETSIEGTPSTRKTWLRESSDLVRTMQADGFDIRGYTWWPLVDFVDWSYASGGLNVEEFVTDTEAAAHDEDGGAPSEAKPLFFREMGLITVDPHDLSRISTAAATQFAALRDPSHARNA